MTPSDLPAFTVQFNRLRAVFPLRADKLELEGIVGAYFRALQRFPIESVEAGAEAWLGSGERFPKPGQWIKAIPFDTALSVPPLSDDEAAEHRRAVSQHYDDEPCFCFLCRSAEVTHRLRRYVPDQDELGRDLRGLLDGKIVVRGHWAHGDELARWYVARDTFMAALAQVRTKLRLVSRAPTERSDTALEAEIDELEQVPEVDDEPARPADLLT